TGNPKGVLVESASLLNLAASLQSALYPYGDRRVRRVGLNASLTFDASMQQVVHLFWGDALVLVPEDVRANGVAFLNFGATQAIDCVDTTPTQMRLWLAAGLGRMDRWRPETMLVGGEAIDQLLWDELRSLGSLRVFNMYGPTECTVDATVCSLNNSVRPSIGRPLGNLCAHVVEPSGQLAQFGMTGELVIGGAGVAAGYWNNPELSAKRFISNFVGCGESDRLYRSGDNARLRMDGLIEYLGRRDGQVKLRGFRIELEEIEAVLRQSSGIRDAAAVVRTIGSEPALVAYVVHTSDPPSSDVEVRAFLRSRLPRFMIPSAIVPVSHLPRTVSGKVDRAALPAPQAASKRAVHVEPRTETESTLQQLWEETLGVRPVGLTDDFFDLGGHSILALQLLSRIERAFGRRLTPSALLQWPTIAALAPVLSQEREPTAGCLVPLRHAATGTPHVWVHPIGGGVLCYAPLAACWPSGTPFYALQSHGLVSGKEPHRSIDEMVEVYLREIRRLDSSRYALGGWSMGGVVALEMARRLDAAGAKIESVTLIDSRPADMAAASLHDRVQRMTFFLRDLQGLSGGALSAPAEDLAQLDLGDAARRVWSEARRRGLMPEGASLEEMEQMLRVFEANAGALRGFTPRPYGGTVNLVIAAAGSLDVASGATMGWERWLGGKVRVRRLPGDHYSIMRPPEVRRLAAILAELESETSAERRG
ncbi:MAG: AMP-binding protein, partial [Myxococcota bacterium]|nr:AMP-binding protein [Myxococcota bacterium]